MESRPQDGVLDDSGAEPVVFLEKISERQPKKSLEERQRALQERVRASDATGFPRASSKLRNLGRKSKVEEKSGLERREDAKSREAAASVMGLVKDARIHEENLDKISKMSSREIQEAVQEIENTLPPDMVAFLRKRKKRKPEGNSSQAERKANGAPAPPTPAVPPPQVEEDRPHVKREGAASLPRGDDASAFASTQDEDSRLGEETIRFGVGDEAPQPGYTLAELMNLSRSVHRTQSAMALQTLARVLARRAAVFWLGHDSKNSTEDAARAQLPRELPLTLRQAVDEGRHVAGVGFALDALQSYLGIWRQDFSRAGHRSLAWGDWTERHRIVRLAWRGEEGIPPLGHPQNPYPRLASGDMPRLYATPSDSADGKDGEDTVLDHMLLIEGDAAGGMLPTRLHVRCVTILRKIGMREHRAACMRILVTMAERSSEATQEVIHAFGGMNKAVREIVSLIVEENTDFLATSSLGTAATVEAGVLLLDQLVAKDRGFAEILASTGFSDLLGVLAIFLPLDRSRGAEKGAPASVPTAQVCSSTCVQILLLWRSLLHYGLAKDSQSIIQQLLCLPAARDHSAGSSTSETAPTGPIGSVATFDIQIGVIRGDHSLVVLAQMLTCMAAFFEQDDPDADESDASDSGRSDTAFSLLVETWTCAAVEVLKTFLQPLADQSRSLFGPLFERATIDLETVANARDRWQECFDLAACCAAAFRVLAIANSLTGRRRPASLEASISDAINDLLCSHVFDVMRPDNTDPNLLFQQLCWPHINNLRDDREDLAPTNAGHLSSVSLCRGLACFWWSLLEAALSLLRGLKPSLFANGTFLSPKATLDIKAACQAILRTSTGTSKWLAGVMYPPRPGTRATPAQEGMCWSALPWVLIRKILPQGCLSALQVLDVWGALPAEDLSTAMASVSLCGFGCEYEASRLVSLGIKGSIEDQNLSTRLERIHTAAVSPNLECIRQSQQRAVRRASTGVAQQTLRSLNSLPRPGDSLLPLPYHWFLLPLGSAGPNRTMKPDIGSMVLGCTLSAVRQWQEEAIRYATGANELSSGATYLTSLHPGLLTYFSCAAALYGLEILASSANPWKSSDSVPIASELLDVLSNAIREVRRCHTGSQGGLGIALEGASRMCEKNGKRCGFGFGLEVLGRDLCEVLAAPSTAYVENPGDGVESTGDADHDLAMAARSAALYTLLDLSVVVSVRKVIWSFLGPGEQAEKGGQEGAVVSKTDGSGLLHLLGPETERAGLQLATVLRQLRLSPSGDSESNDSDDMLDLYIECLKSPHARFDRALTFPLPFSVLVSHFQRYLAGEDMAPTDRSLSHDQVRRARDLLELPTLDAAAAVLFQGGTTECQKRLVAELEKRFSKDEMLLVKVARISGLFEHVNAEQRRMARENEG